MLPPALALLGALVTIVFASVRDPIGWGYLLSTDVGDVAEARLSEHLLSLPPLYFVAGLLSGAAVILTFDGAPTVIRWLAGVAAATFLTGTIWDLRRRRGTLAVYLRLRRKEIGFEPKGGVIEAPKLVFLVMNQPTPLIWLVTAIAGGVAAVLLFPHGRWLAAAPLSFMSVVLVWMWYTNRHSLWEAVARRIRRASRFGGDALVEYLEHSLELDPEVLLLRHEAEMVVARFLDGTRQ